jgi:hypothetical protein
MIPVKEPLIAFFLGLYFQLFTPSQPGREVVGIDFGEPTRDCAGRGQICRIDQLGNARWKSNPEALGERWTDSLGWYHLSVRELWWDAEADSLYIPGEEPGYYRGVRENGRIQFLMRSTKQ